MKFSDINRSPLEKHIMQLVEHVQKGYDTRAGFMAMIDQTLSHARHIEEVYHSLVEENNKLKNIICMPMPHYKFNMDTRLEPVMFDEKVFVWQMQTVQYREYIRPFNLNDTSLNYREKFWSLVKRKSYKEFIKHFRKEFETNFIRFVSNHQ